MFRDINAIEKYLHINKEEKSEIQSWRRPILLLKTKYDFNPDINDGLNTIGAILPYMPVHYLLFEHFKSEAIIFTSGNYSDAPIIKKNDEAIKCLLPFTDIHIDNNREIINQCDDSIVQIIDNKPTIIRRSRGYVPEPYVSSLKTEGILACGAQMN